MAVTRLENLPRVALFLMLPLAMGIADTAAAQGLGGFIRDPVGTSKKAAGNASNDFKRGTSKAGKSIGSGANQTRKAIGSGANTAKGWGNQANKSARGAAGSIGRETSRGWNSARGAASQQGKNLGNIYNQGKNNLNRGLNSAKSGLGNQGRNLGNLYNNGGNALGRARDFGGQSINRGLGGNNFQPRLPDLSRQPERWRQSAEDNARGFGENVDRATRAPRRAAERAVRNPVVRGVQEGVRQSNVPRVVQEGAQRVIRGDGSPSGGAGSILPGAISNLPQNVVNAPSGAVKIVTQAAAPVDQALKNAERGARDFGGAIAEGSRELAKDGAQGATAIGKTATRTSEEVFSGGGTILGNGLEQGGQAVADLGKGAGTILAAGGAVVVQAAEDGAALYQQGEKVVQDAQQIYEEGQARYEDVRAGYDTLRRGDRAEVLEMVEDTTGVRVDGEVKKALLETDLVDAVELVEDATGVDLENAKQRVAQAQGIADAARTGKLSEMEEAAGAKSNRADVRAEKEAGWDSTVYGKEIDHEQYVEMMGAGAASIATANAGPLMAYAKEWAAEQYQTLAEGLREQGKAELAEKLNEQMLIDALQGAMNGQPATLPIKGVTIDVGLATYNHRLEASAGIPEITSRGIEINQKNATTSLPNTHQPYVRFKFDE